MEHSKGGVSTLIEVFRCELGRPGRSPILSSDGIGPTKAWTPLYYAVHHNREAALSYFLRAGQSPDGVPEVGQPPLCVAVTAGHLSAVNALLKANANINAATKHDSETALHLAIKIGRSDIVEALLSHGPDLSARTLSTRETPLHYAASKPASLAIVVILLKNGANYEAPNAQGDSPAATALHAQNIPAAVAIIGSARGKRAKLAKEKEMLLKHVEKSQSRFSMNNELIADIFEAGCPSDSTILVEAIKRDDTGLVEMFLEKGADPNRATGTGLYPIFAALEHSGPKVIHVLVKHGAEVTLRDSQGLTVLQAAFDCPLVPDKEAILSVFTVLLVNGADPLVRYPDGTTLLHRAVQLGLPKVAQQMLKYGVKVNDQDGEGNTALHAAIHNRSCLAVVLKHRADVHILNNAGDTPLLHATRTTQKQQEPDLEQLITISNPSTKDRDGKTALHLAAENGLEKTIRLLLQQGADTTSTTAQERTPLHLAILNHQWHVIPLLAVQPGINSWDEEGTTALHHIAMSIPNPPSSWKDIARAVAPFCEKGVSRIMRDRSGATPLIQAIKTLPEEGLPVVEVLLSEKGSRGSNCIGHEDLQGLDALFYAATLGKPAFVEILLKYGAPFILKTWKPNRGPVQPTNEANKCTLKLIAECEWLRRITAVHRQSSGAQTESIFAKVIPIRDLIDLLTMGLDPNALPRARPANSLLWVILHQTSLPQPPPPRYLHEFITAVFSAGADPNAISHRGSRRTSPGRNSPPVMLAVHPLTFLLEQCPDADIELVVLFLDKGAQLSIASPLFEGRYPLHSAVQAKRIDIVDRFMSGDADVSSVDAKGRTPLFLAAENGNWEIFNALLRGGATSNIRDNEGSTILHYAAAGGNSNIISALIRAGVKATEPNQTGALPSSCVGDHLDEVAKSKVTRLLTLAEEREQRESELRQQEEALLKKQAEKRALKEREKQEREREERERQELQRQERDKQAREKAASEKQAREKEASAKQAREKEAIEKQARTANEGRKRVSNFFASASKLPAQHAVKLSPRVDSTRNTSLHDPKQGASVKSSSTSKQPESAPKLSAASVKPLPPQPRTDSGLDVERSDGGEKPLPPLSRDKKRFDSEEKRESGSAELADWLALSQILDRL